MRSLTSILAGLFAVALSMPSSAQEGTAIVPPTPVAPTVPSVPAGRPAEPVALPATGSQRR